MTNKRYYSHEDQLIEGGVNPPTYFEMESDEDNIWNTLIKQKRKILKRKLDLEKKRKLQEDARVQ